LKQVINLGCHLNEAVCVCTHVCETTYEVMAQRCVVHPISKANLWKNRLAVACWLLECVKRTVNRGQQSQTHTLAES
jgi:hypothetical protein